MYVKRLLTNATHPDTVVTVASSFTVPLPTVIRVEADTGFGDGTVRLALPLPTHGEEVYHPHERKYAICNNIIKFVK